MQKKKKKKTEMDTLNNKDLYNDIFSICTCIERKIFP